MSRAERAKQLFQQGYACSQAVVLAFSDLTGVDEDKLASLSLPFGGGLSRLRLTCGAVSGMAMVYGLLFSSPNLDAENKKRTYEECRTLLGKFSAETGSLICADLLSGKNLQVQVGGDAEKRTDEYYKKRPCADLVYLATEIMENFVKEKGL